MAPKDLQRAAHWHARLADTPEGPSGDAAQAGFSAWLQMRGEHQIAYQAVVEAEALARALSDTPELRAIGDAALARAPDGRVRRRTWGIAALICTACVAPVAAMTINGWLSAPKRQMAPTAPRSFVTGVGERREIDLGQYGQVTLDTSTRLDITGTTMRVTGQAYLMAGRKPVILTVGDGVVVTAGGNLNVRTNPGRVTILAERASATASGALSQPIEIEPGNVLVLDDAGPRVSAAADPAAVISWRDGWLIFDDVPLSYAAAEINRYRTVPIQLTQDARAVRISGSFRTDDGAGFLKAAAAVLPSAVRRTTVTSDVERSGPLEK